MKCSVGQTFLSDMTESDRTTDKNVYLTSRMVVGGSDISV